MRVTNDDKKPSLEEALEHYGVKGMRWGVRRSDEQLAKARGERIRGIPKRAVKKALDAQKKAATSVAKGIKGVATNPLVLAGAVLTAHMMLTPVPPPSRRSSSRSSPDFKLKVTDRQGRTSEYGTEAAKAYDRLSKNGADWITGPTGETVMAADWNADLPASYSDFTVDPSGVAERRKSA